MQSTKSIFYLLVVVIYQKETTFPCRYKQFKVLILCWDAINIFVCKVQRDTKHNNTDKVKTKQKI